MHFNKAGRKEAGEDVFAFNNANASPKVVLPQEAQALKRLGESTGLCLDDLPVSRLDPSILGGLRNLLTPNIEYVTGLVDTVSLCTRL
jgi:hypothetical protein